DGTVTMEPFAEGWLDEESGEYLGRPVDVAQLPDGSILVSDDLAGAIYRIAYTR
ncbi:MAG: sorbosone dehydrogenase, partial [Pseudomonadota bacterium]